MAAMALDRAQSWPWLAGGRQIALGGMVAAMVLEGRMAESQMYLAGQDSGDGPTRVVTKPK
jgi:hypothetical protein